jgi:hypothetical protein
MQPREWAEKHVDAGDAYWSGGACRFYSAGELIARRAERANAPAPCAPRSAAARMHGHHGHRVTEAPPDYSQGSAPFLPYPQPERTARATRSLAARYPGLANCHA